MELISIFNDVMGPIMRGPSSSHTCGSFFIGTMVRSLMEDIPDSVTFTFDPHGSYAQVYRQQGVDVAFGAGLLGWQITDECFSRSLNFANKQGIDIKFKIAPLKNANHPNTVLIEMTNQNGEKIKVKAQSIGGGAVRIVELNDWRVELTGNSYETVMITDISSVSDLTKFLTSDGKTIGTPVLKKQKNKKVFMVQRTAPLNQNIQNQIKKHPDVQHIWSTSPISFIKKGKSLFTSASEMVVLANDQSCSLGQLALKYESELLEKSNKETLNEMIRRYEIMKSSVSKGFIDQNIGLKLLKPSAQKIFKAESEKKVAIGGLHTRAAARALAAMHTCNSMGVVCASPTGGSAGVIPGVLVTLSEERNLKKKESALALFAASAIGLIIARRATFAAESAGCQVEIGAAGAMAAAAVVEIAGGRATEAADAAAISLQNSMGSVCDLVQGMCEIPCHTRNATASSNALVCADLIIGGYQNPIPLDETIDAVYSVGKMLPPELRCTAKGGLAVTPSASEI